MENENRKMGEYLIINSHVNKQILVLLGYEFREEGQFIVFSTRDSIREATEKIAKLIVALGIESDENRAMLIASSFFINKIG